MAADPTYFTPESAEKGRAVHHGCALDNAGRLVWDERAERMAGFLESNRKLLRSMPKLRIRAIEIRRFHPVWQYAGTVDLALEYGNDEIIADYKSGAIPDSTKYQVWAYDYLDPIRKARKHWGVKLFEDGALAQIHHYDEDRYAGDKFLSLLTATRVRQELGKSKIPTSMPDEYYKETLPQ